MDWFLPGGGFNCRDHQISWAELNVESLPIWPAKTALIREIKWWEKSYPGSDDKKNKRLLTLTPLLKLAEEQYPFVVQPNYQSEIASSSTSSSSSMEVLREYGCFYDIPFMMERNEGKDPGKNLLYDLADQLAAIRAMDLHGIEGRDQSPWSSFYDIRVLK